MSDLVSSLKQLTSLLRSQSARTNLDLAFGKLASAVKAGFNPSQPRHPAGQEAGGQWSSPGNSDIEKIVRAAGRIKGAFDQKYSDCVDLCYTLLERPQQPGSDLNLWDFHKCLNRCLKR